MVPIANATQLPQGAGPPAAPKTLSRRALLRSVSLASLGAVGAACTPNGSSGSGTTTLNWWAGWPNDWVTKVAKQYESEHPHIKVKAGLFYPEPQKLLAAMAGGTGPDIFADIDYYNIMARGVLEPLDSYIKASSRVSLTDGDIPAKSWEAFAWGDKHYGVPGMDTAGRDCMGYNLDLAEKAGLDPNQVPGTWDEIFQWHKKLTTFDKAGNVKVLGLNPLDGRGNATTDGDPWVFPPLWGFEYFSQKSLSYDIDRPETVDFLSTILKFFDYAGATKINGMMNSNQSRPQQAFGQGTEAMCFSYASSPASIYQIAPDRKMKYTWAPVPTSRKGTTEQTLAGHASVIARGSKAKQQAFDLAVYLTEKSACDAMLKSVGWVPLRKSLQKSLDLSHYPKDVQQNILFYVTSVHDAKNLNVVRDPEGGYLATLLSQYFPKLEAHSITPKAMATALQAAMTKQIATDKPKFSKDVIGG